MDINIDRPVLGSCKSAKELLNIYFLDIRSALLESAAALDRIERADVDMELSDCERIFKLKQACDIIKNENKNRAEHILMLFSEPSE